MHGLPIAVGRWERIPDAGGATIQKSGNWDFVDGKYAEAEDASEFRIELRNPGWYLIGVQCETLVATTEIELLDTTAEAINPLGRWKRAQFVQVDDISADSTGSADPSYTTLTRNWQPAWHAAIWWTVKTTTANQRVRFKVTNGTTASNQRRELAVWRLATMDADHIAPPNVLGNRNGSTAGSVSATPLTPAMDVDLEPYPAAYRVTVSATDAANRFIFWEIGARTIHDAHFCHNDFTHEIRFKIKTTSPSTATGTVTLRVFAATAGVIHSSSVAYGPTETETVVAFARRSAGDQISQVEIKDIGPSDAIDVSAVLNVTE